MAKYGKWVGLGLGWALGGPIGGILGLVFGGMYDGMQGGKFEYREGAHPYGVGGVREHRLVILQRACLYWQQQ